MICVDSNHEVLSSLVSFLKESEILHHDKIVIQITNFINPENFQITESLKGLLNETQFTILFTLNSHQLTGTHSKTQVALNRIGF